MLIDNYLCGWAHLEPVILASIARGMNILLLGKHGCGKSSLGKFISDALKGEKEDYKFSKYYMDKENLISMVGIPSPEDLKQGRLEYVKHNRSIFNADAILMDEITRAPKENQNMILEALEEKTIFGYPLKYEFVIATANDETYQGAFKLDAALLDRFLCVIPVPTTDTESESMAFGSEEIKKAIELNLDKRKYLLEESNAHIRDAVEKIRQTYDEILDNKELIDNVLEFCSKFFSLVLSTIKDINKNTKNKIYISPRQWADQFVKIVFAISAYYKAIRGEHEYLEKGAKDAITYSIGTKLGIPLDKVYVHFDALKDLLTEQNGMVARIKIEINTGPVENRIIGVAQNAAIIGEKFEDHEIINSIGNILNEINNDFDLSDPVKMMSLLDMYSAVKENDISLVCTHQIEMKLFDKILEHINPPPIESLLA